MHTYVRAIQEATPTMHIHVTGSNTTSRPHTFLPYFHETKLNFNIDIANVTEMTHCTRLFAHLPVRTTLATHSTALSHTLDT